MKPGRPTPRSSRSSPGPALALLAAAGSFLSYACSSGLEGRDGKGTTGAEQPAESTNLRFAFDPNVELTHPITALELFGGVIPRADGSRERPVAFVAFATQSVLVDPDDGTSDTNGESDVFVAAVDADSIDPNAFAYSIAGTMRHPRCVTCHQMNVDVAQDPDALPPTPFLTQRHFPDGGGAPPLNDFDDGDCRDCHFPDWLAPGPTFDLRRTTTRELFLRAQAPPTGLEEHFRTDPRVLWALDTGDTPFGGAADDDHDGVDEPEDHDGVRRHAPGGKARFLERLDGFLATADPDTGEFAFSSAPDAVQDVVLVSRADFGNQAGNAASRAPSLVYQPNPGFDPGNPTVTPAGFLFVAYESDASDMNGGTANVRTDVFRVTVDVFLTAEDTLDLVFRNGSQICASTAFDGSDGDGNSTDPDIGANGTRIAFVSEAFDLVDGLPVRCRPEVYLFDEIQGVALVSHVDGSVLEPGDAGAIGPDLSPDGMAVSFESDATNLVPGDTNGTRDVFFSVAASWPALTVQRASVADGGGELAGHSHAGSIFHSGGDVKVAFACREGALPPVESVACPDVVVVLTAVRDTHLREGRFNNDETANFGTADLSAGTTGDVIPPPDPGSFGETRSLVAFDLSSIPAGATINSAILSMRVNMVPSGDGMGGPGSGGCFAGGEDSDTGLHVLTQDWAENEATWLQRLTGVPWSTAGANGDFVASASATTTLTTATNYQWSSAQMAADVQSWLDSGANFGWLVRGSSASCTVKRIDSREDVLPPASPPRLTIDYTPPVQPRAEPVVAAGASSVFVRDTALDRTIDLSRIVSPEGTVAARELDVDGTTLSASSTNPVMSPYGNAVLFETMAQNLDSVRPFDENRVMDVVLADLLQFEAQGFVLPYTLSVTADGGNANGPSHGPRFGAFAPPTDAFPLGLAAYATQATNLGDSDPGDLDEDGVPESDNFMLAFLSEGGSVLADFEARPARQGMGRGVAFESKASGEPTSFLWDFGDGATSSERAPQHVYDTPGRYDVTLTVSGELGTDQRTRIEYVHVLDAVMAAFASTKDTRAAPAQAAADDVPFTTPVAGAIDDADPDSALFFDLSSTGSTEFPDEFEWSLTPVDAGGTPLGPPVVISEEPDPQDVRVDATGLYDLTLEATGPGGAGMATQRLGVFQKVTAAFDTNPSGPIVRGPANLVVQFTDRSTGDLLDAGAHSWVFGDGASSTEASPTHAYAAGVHFARLTVFGKGTDADVTATVPVIADGVITSAWDVLPRPAGSVSGVLFGEGVDEGTGVLVDFLDRSQTQGPGPISYSWSFGTGAPTGQENVPNPTGILYALANPENVQTFAVSLFVFDFPFGDVRAGSVTVYPRPMVAFAPPAASFAAAPLRPPHAVQLDGEVVGDGTGTAPSYRWLRSEPNQAGATIVFATELDTVFEFPDPGTYEVVLEVETNGPGGARQTVQSAPQDVVVSAATLTEWVTQAVAAGSGSRCTNCHKGANPPAGLSWQGTPAEIFQEIVEDAQGNPVLSTRCNTAKRRIQPFEPEESVVYNVLRKPPGPLCAINMRVNLPGDELEKDAHLLVLRSWILGGALND